MVKLEQIKKELEKKETLDEKREYLEKLLRDAKDEKLISETKKIPQDFRVPEALLQSIKNLLAEVEEHIKHEEKFAGEKLERRITSWNVAEEEAPARNLREIIHGPTSKLEEEVAGAPSIRTRRAISAASEPAGSREKEEYVSPTAMYERERAVEAARNYLKQAGITNFTEDTLEHMTGERRRAVFETVSKAFGEPEDYEKLTRYVSSVFSEKREEKYKIK